MIAAPEDKAPVDAAASGEVASAPAAESRVELCASTATPAEMAPMPAPEMAETDRAGVTTHHVDDYSVANLDDLLVRLVEEELAYQNPHLAQAQ